MFIITIFMVGRIEPRRNSVDYSTSSQSSQTFPVAPTQERSGIAAARQGSVMSSIFYLSISRSIIITIIVSCGLSIGLNSAKLKLFLPVIISKQSSLY